MPRFQRCLAQADELAPVARLTIDQQRGRRIAPSYGVAATIPIVNGRFASSPTFPSDETHSGASRDEPGRAHASRTGRMVTSLNCPPGTKERQARGRGKPDGRESCREKVGQYG